MHFMTDNNKEKIMFYKFCDANEISLENSDLIMCNSQLNLDVSMITEYIEKSKGYFNFINYLILLFLVPCVDFI